MTEFWCGCCPRARVVRRKRRKKRLIRQILRTRGQGNGIEGDPTWSYISTVVQILNSLEEEQLINLLAGIQVRGGRCVFGDPSDDLSPSAAAILAKSWRWYNESSDYSQVKSIPLICSHPGSCINPFHQSIAASSKKSPRLGFSSEDSSPPPPYCEAEFTTTESSVKNIMNQCSTCGVTNETDIFSFQGQNVTWCKLAYWEESKRVGALTPVNRSVINISGMPIMSLSSERHCNSSSKYKRRLAKSGHDLNAITSCNSDLNEEWFLRLPSIFIQNENPSDSVLKIREKLGKGVILEKSEDHGEVWLYNISSVPVFVSSPTLEDNLCQASPFSVHKLPPGSHVKVFDYTNCQKMCVKFWRSLGHGPIDPYALQISFGKGWGANYSRQDVMSCPSWLEVYLDPQHRIRKS